MGLPEFTGEKVTILLTSNCNIKCKHCYVDYSGQWDVQELKILIPELKLKYKISLNGAEPLTDIKYLDLYPIAGYKRIFSNGLIITKNPDIISKLKDADITTVSISYHFSSPSICDLDEDIVEKSISLLINNGFNVEMNTTITKENYIKISEICKKAKKLKVRSLYFFNLINKGRARLQENLLLSKDEIKTFIYLMETERQKYNKDELYIAREGTFQVAEDIGNKEFYCYAYEHVVLAPDKKIYPCIFMVDNNNEYGFLKDNQLYVNPDKIDIRFNKKTCLAAPCLSA